MNKTYAGIGPRITPADQRKRMTHFAQCVDLEYGWKLRSGHARGADQAFEAGARKQNRQIFIPYTGYEGAFTDEFIHLNYISDELWEKAIEIAKLAHKGWNKLDPLIQSFMIRNVFILLGSNLDDPVEMVVYWQPLDNIINDRGGTNHSLRVARNLNIPAYNINVPDEEQKIIDTIRL